MHTLNFVCKINLPWTYIKSHPPHSMSGFLVAPQNTQRSARNVSDNKTCWRRSCLPCRLSQKHVKVIEAPHTHRPQLILGLLFPGCRHIMVWGKCVLKTETWGFPRIHFPGNPQKSWLYLSIHCGFTGHSTPTRIMCIH